MTSYLAFPIQRFFLLFADDSKCFRPISVPRNYQLLQKDISSLLQWFSDNYLDINSTKSVFISFNSLNVQDFSYCYTLSGITLPSSSSTKDLGVIVSSDGNWSSHLDYVISSALKTLSLLHRLFSHTDSEYAKRQLYLALVRSNLLYSSQVWRPKIVRDVSKLEKVQRLATRFILNDYSSTYRERLIKTGLLPLSMVLEINDILFFVHSLLFPTPSFNIRNFVQFYSKPSTNRLVTLKKLKPSPIYAANDWMYFNRCSSLEHSPSI